LFSLVYVGVDGIEGFFRVLLVSGRGENYHTGEEHMFNTIGLLLRTVPALPRLYVRWTGWSTYLLAIIGLCVLWARVPRVEERHVSLAVILSLFTAPHSHINDLVLLIVPVVGLLLVLVRKRYLLEQDAVFLPLGVSLVLLFSFFTESLKYSLSYLVMLFLLLAVWFPEKLFRRKTLQRMA